VGKRADYWKSRVICGKQEEEEREGKLKEDDDTRGRLSRVSVELRFLFGEKYVGKSMLARMGVLRF
jgi:hypothetical protein